MDFKKQPKTLAWHETLELHELTVLKSVGLMKMKKGLKQIEDKELKGIFKKSIAVLEASLAELLKFYPYAPKPDDSSEYREVSVFYAADLLLFTKIEVRSYAIAITETATPMLREVLKRHLNTAIECHERIFNYMHEKELYPSYDLNELLSMDVTLAKRALSL